MPAEQPETIDAVRLAAVQISIEIDAMIAAMLRAKNREDFVAAVRALDRVLISGSYLVPLFHLPAQWIARATKIDRPETTSLSGYLPETWWSKPPGDGVQP